MDWRQRRIGAVGERTGAMKGRQGWPGLVALLSFNFQDKLG